MEWDFFWCDRDWARDNFPKVYLPEYARISHFVNHVEVTNYNLVNNLHVDSCLAQAECGMRCCHNIMWILICESVNESQRGFRTAKLLYI